MLQTVEAEIDESGEVRLLEPVRVTKKERAIVTILENENSGAAESGNARKILQFLQNNRLPNHARLSIKEIEVQTTEARESWD